MSTKEVKTKDSILIQFHNFKVWCDTEKTEDKCLLKLFEVKKAMDEWAEIKVRIALEGQKGPVWVKVEKLRIWLDDVRPMPAGFDFHVKNVEDAIMLINSGGVEFISLDNDLGIGFKQGKVVAQYIEEMVITGKLPFVDFHPHTDNPVAWEEILACKRAIHKYADESPAPQPKDGEMQVIVLDDGRSVHFSSVKDLARDFSDGLVAFKKSIEQRDGEKEAFAIGFSRWADENWYRSGGKDYYYHDGEGATTYTPQELITLYKSSLEKEGKKKT